MAFMGIILMYLVIIIIILGISAFVSASCFIVSGIIMAIRRRKIQESGKSKGPWYVTTLRVIGTIAAIPCVGAVVLVLCAVIWNAVDENTNLPRAVMYYDFEQAEKILDNGADPDARDKYGRTLLMCLAEHDKYISPENDEYYGLGYVDDWNQVDENDMRMMEILLKHGADINAQREDCGDKAMHECGEDIWAKMGYTSEHSCGNTPLLYAVRFRSPDIVSFLIENGADINMENSCGFTPVLMAVDNRADGNGAEIVRMLIDAGADLDEVTNFYQDIYFLLYRHNGRDIEDMEKIINDNWPLS